MRAAPTLTRSGRRAGVVVALLAAVASVTGCGASPSAPTALAAQFARALRDADGVRACEMLAPETRSELEQSAEAPCPEALRGEDLSPGRELEGTRFGTMAQVRFTGDTFFLGRFGSSWKIVAAGCTPRPGRPYDCRIQGG